MFTDYVAKSAAAPHVVLHTVQFKVLNVLYSWFLCTDVELSYSGSEL